jgi:hypothetical protein
VQVRRVSICTVVLVKQVKRVPSTAGEGVASAEAAAKIQSALRAHRARGLWILAAAFAEILAAASAEATPERSASTSRTPACARVT